MQKIDADKLEKMMNLQERWEDRQAEKSFHHALAEFQRRAPIIEKADDAHGKKYARLDRIWRTVRPLVTELGLSVTWQKCEIVDGVCKVEGLLAHAEGKSIELSRSIPVPEMIRGQNASQQAGSAESYAKRYALCAALGIVTGDDDDGYNAGTAFLTVEQAKSVQDLLDQLDDKEVEKALLQWAECETVEEIPSSKYHATIRSLKSKLK